METPVLEAADIQAQRAGRGPAAGPHTWEDFVALPDDDRRELIDGELIEVEVPTGSHEYVVAMLSFFLIQWARPKKAGAVYSSGYKVRVSEGRGIMPDIQFYRTGNPAVRQPQGVISGAPDLAVEVISPGSERYDRVTKLNWYAQLGAAEYWVVTPESQTLERLVLRDGKYTLMEALSGTETFSPDSFPGLEIPLAELWEPPGAAAGKP